MYIDQIEDKEDKCMYAEKVDLKVSGTFVTYSREEYQVLSRGDVIKSNSWVQPAAYRRFDLFPVIYNHAQSDDLKSTKYWIQDAKMGFWTEEEMIELEDALKCRIVLLFFRISRDFGCGSFDGDARNIGDIFKKRYDRPETQIIGFSSLLQAYQIQPRAGQTLCWLRPMQSPQHLISILNLAIILWRIQRYALH